LRVAIAGISNDPGRRPGEDPLADVAVDDPENIISSADVGLLIAHAAVGGQEDTFLSEVECVIQPESLARLRGFQVVVTGHIHRFQQRMVAGIATVVCGPSEWMDFGDVGAGSPGYAWLEIGAQGLRSATHVNLPAQPRRTLTLETADIFPDGADVPSATSRVIGRLAPLCGPDVMVRLWLRGYVTREQYRALDLPQLHAWGQANCFAFEINERGLTWQADMVATDLSAVRGERIAPRDVLARIAGEQITGAAEPDRDLWEATRQALLQRFDAIQGEE
jgi:hypothetical protein